MFSSRSRAVVRAVFGHVRIPFLVVGLLVATLAVSNARVATGWSTLPPSAFDWPAFHNGSAADGYASNSSLSTANASQLGVHWATNLYGPALDSPVVFYDASLNARLVIIGNESGDVYAVNLASGRIAWSTFLGSAIRVTPVVANGAVFLAVLNTPRIFKLDATTGSVDCSVSAPEEVEGTPIAASPPGGVPSVYFGTLDTATSSGPILAINQADCSIEWSFTDYASPAGSWSPMSYAVDAHGQPLVLFGTSDPDCSVYAVNAVTGALDWRYGTYSSEDWDFGAGPLISAPGNNGIADGAVYIQQKKGVMYALDLTTGALIWSYNYRTVFKVPGGYGMAALRGTSLVFGYRYGYLDLNAVTGRLEWVSNDQGDESIESSPAIAGPAGEEIVVAGDLGGGIDVVSLASGAPLYRYQTDGYITASPAVSGGDILIASSNGFLYDLEVGGGNEATLPSTTITSPADSSSVTNPNGQLTISGTAADQVGVAGVAVAVQEGGADGPWWNAATASWVPAPVDNRAVLSSPEAPSSGWTLTIPVPATGATFVATANAVSVAGQTDPSGATTHFAVLTSSSALLSASSNYAPPGTTLTVSGKGFAPSETVTIAVYGTEVGTATTSLAGTFHRVIGIPAVTPIGRTFISATGANSGESATTAITVTNNWSQVGYGATHTNVEPLDNALLNNISPGQGIFLNPEWSYGSPASLVGSPVVADQVAYVGDTAGNVTALDVRHGVPLWTMALPSAAPIDSSLAVDPAVGLVFVGASNGTLYALSSATGAVKWSDVVGGSLAAPVFSKGELFVTSQSGLVEAVSEATGAVSWSTMLQSPVSTAASVDAAGGVVLAGESNGTLAALSTQSGSVLWTYAGGGTISAPAVVSGGSVYVAAGNTVYSLEESTGGEQWAFATGGPIVAEPVLTNQWTYRNEPFLMFGSDDGNVDALLATNGSLQWQLNVGEPIIGLADTAGFLAFTTSTDLIGGTRTWDPQQIWSNTSSGSVYSAAPIIVDGTVYATRANGNLTAFTEYGHHPF